MSDSYNLSMRNPILNTSPISMYGQQTPTAQRLTLENQYQSLAQQISPNQQQPQQQSNPYSDYLETFSSCNNLTQRKIQEDQRYQEIYNQCQSALLHEAFSQVMPAVLSTQQGRTLFERLNATTQFLKEEYTQQELQREKQLEDREKATEQEKQQLEAQKQELAIMLAQIKELQQTTPTPSQQAQIQPLQSTPTQFPTPHQNASQDIVEPITATQNNSQNQSNQQNTTQHQNNNNNRKNNNKPQNGGSSE